MSDFEGTGCYYIYFIIKGNVSVSVIILEIAEIIYFTS